MDINEIKKKSIELNLKLAESAYDLFSGYGLLYGQDLYDGGYGAAGWGYGPSPSPLWAQSQKRGEVIPVYLNEIQLRRIRDRSRRLCQESGYAICAIENLKNYIVGKGLVYRAVSKRPEIPAETMAPLLKQVNELIDLFRHANDLAEWEADCVLRLARDGECIIRLFETPSGLLVLRPVEAEHLRSPVGDSFGPEYTFGIQTMADDIMTIQGYWIVEQPIISPLPRFVSKEEIVHIKLNTDRSAKRGLPMFYPVESNFRRVEDLLVSMTSLAKQRAKIAMIRKMKGMAQSAASALTQSLTDISITDPTTSEAINFERMRPGTIITSPDGIEYEYPSADVDASSFVAILECELRAICARMNWPDWMLTSNAGAASFASGLIAEAPSTRMFERLQALFSKTFGECSFPGKESLIWRQLRIAQKRGALPSNLDELIEIQAECPTLVVRDKSQEATVNQTYLETKIKSPQTVQQEQGLDTEQEARNWAEWEAAHPQQQPALPGMPGMPANSGGGNGPDQMGGGNPNPGEQRPPGPGGPAKEECITEAIEASHGHDEDNVEDAAPLIAEILFDLFGKDALKHLDDKNIKEAWNAADHPRGKGGKFIPKGSPEAVAAAKDVVRQALKGHGDAATVANHLAILTVKQLRELHKENGVKKIPSEILREHLVQAVKDKLTPASKQEKKEEKPEEPKSSLPDQEQPASPASHREEDKPQKATSGPDRELSGELKSKLKYATTNDSGGTHFIHNANPESVASAVGGGVYDVEKKFTSHLKDVADSYGADWDHVQNVANDPNHPERSNLDIVASQAWKKTADDINSHEGNIVVSNLGQVADKYGLKDPVKDIQGAELRSSRDADGSAFIVDSNIQPPSGKTPWNEDEFQQGQAKQKQSRDEIDKGQKATAKAKEDKAKADAEAERAESEKQARAKADAEVARQYSPEDHQSARAFMREREYLHGLLSAGKEVPDSVLAAYPDLAQYYASKNKGKTQKPEYVRHPSSGDEEELVHVDPHKLDRDWQKDDKHIGHGEEDRPGARAAAQEHLDSGKPIEASRVALDANGDPSFIDGRHRFAVARDNGVNPVGVMAHKDDLEQIKQRYGTGGEEPTSHQAKIDDHKNRLDTDNETPADVLAASMIANAEKYGSPLSDEKKANLIDRAHTFFQRSGEFGSKVDAGDKDAIRHIPSGRSSDHLNIRRPDLFYAGDTTGIFADAGRNAEDLHKVRKQLRANVNNGNEPPTPPPAPPATPEQPEEEPRKFLPPVSPANRKPLDDTSLEPHELPHNMTKERFQKQHPGAMSSDHKNLISQALEKGEDVPQHVLDEYPDLAEKAQGLVKKPISGFEGKGIDQLRSELQMHEQKHQAHKDRLAQIDKELHGHWSNRAALKVKDTEHDQGIIQHLPHVQGKMVDELTPEQLEHKKALSSLYGKRERGRRKIQQVDSDIRHLNQEKEETHNKMKSAADSVAAARAAIDSHPDSKSPEPSPKPKEQQPEKIGSAMPQEKGSPEPREQKSLSTQVDNPSTASYNPDSGKQSSSQEKPKMITQPTLKGSSQKQIDYANSVREKLIAHRPDLAEDAAKITSAKEWLDNKEQLASYVKGVSLGLPMSNGYAIDSETPSGFRAGMLFGSPAKLRNYAGAISFLDPNYPRKDERPVSWQDLAVNGFRAGVSPEQIQSHVEKLGITQDADGNPFDIEEIKKIYEEEGQDFPNYKVGAK